MKNSSAMSAKMDERSHPAYGRNAEFAYETDQATRALLRVVMVLCEQGLDTHPDHQVPMSVKKGLGRAISSIFDLENTTTSFIAREKRRTREEQ